MENVIKVSGDHLIWIRLGRQDITAQNVDTQSGNHGIKEKRKVAKKLTKIPVLKVDERNKNGRIYPKEVVEEALLAYKEKINAKSSFGELESGEGFRFPGVNLDSASHLITDIDLGDDGIVYANITLLDTPMGRIAQDITEGGDVHFASRGVGFLNGSEGEVTSLQLTSFDVSVGDSAWDFNKPKSDTFFTLSDLEDIIHGQR